MVCPPWHVSLAWRSPRSIPTGQDGRRPLQHKLGVTYIYVLKCITHRRPPRPLTPAPPDGVAFLLPPASTLLGLASHSATRTPNFIIIISPAWCTYLPIAESEFCKSRAALAPLTIILKRKFERVLVNSACTAANCAFGVKRDLVPSLLRTTFLKFLFATT